MKKLEELFELASSDESNYLSEPLPEQTQEVTETALSNLEKIENALPQVRGLEKADEELDELAQGPETEQLFKGQPFSVCMTPWSEEMESLCARLHQNK